MGKHIQESQYYGKQGFSAIKVGDNLIVPENTEALLELIPGVGMSLEVKNNKVTFDTTIPIFTKKEW